MKRNVEVIVWKCDLCGVKSTIIFFAWSCFEKNVVLLVRFSEFGVCWNRLV